MALIILPGNSGEDAVARAQARLAAAIDDPHTVVALVAGDGAGVERTLEVAVARASVKPNIRRVVWVQDTTVLTAEQQTAYFADSYVFAVIGLSDQVAAQLDELHSGFRLYVERAFLEGEKA